MRIHIAIIFLIVIVLPSCKKTSTGVETRSFYMGVTPWPSDFTAPAVDEAYKFINEHCDIVSHHFDEGIPYEEASKGLPMPAGLLQDMQTRKSKTAPGKAVLLEVAPLELNRKEKAGYYSLSNNQVDSIKNYWKQLPFNDTKVVTAYINYVSYLVDELHPAFVNYGVESNEISWDPSDFALYKNFLSKVYTQLKSKYATLPFFVSMMVSEAPLAIQYAQQLLSYTDYLTLSAYPYITSLSTTNGNTDPKLFAPDFFQRFINLAPDKPFAFAETGYIAEDLKIPAYNLDKNGKSEWQKEYLDLVCKLCKERKAKFVIWFCHQDYDAGNTRLKQLGIYQDVFAFWEDTGLTDENGQTRPAYSLWLDWMKKSKE